MPNMIEEPTGPDVGFDDVNVVVQRDSVGAAGFASAGSRDELVLAATCGAMASVIAPPWGYSATASRAQPLWLA